MNLKKIQISICAAVLIGALCSAGCTFLSGEDTAVPADSAAPSVTTPIVTTKVAITKVPVTTVAAKPTVTTPAITTTLRAGEITVAASVVPTAAVTVAGTVDPWENFVEDTSIMEDVITESPTAAETIVSITTTPTPVPTAVSIPYSCSHIGGNFCTASEICSGALIITTDDAQCCAGTCETR